MKNVIAAVVLAAAGTAVSGGVIGIQLDPSSEASVDAPLFDQTFGVSGSLGIGVEQDGDGKISDATLCAADILVHSFGVYSFAGAGSLTLSNIGISLEEKGEQEYFYNETQGSSQPGDYVGFLDVDAIAALTGMFSIDIDGDGNDDLSQDLSTISEEFTTFDFEPLITREGGSNVYVLETTFFLTIDVDFAGQPFPITIEFTGGGSGVIPVPGSLAALFIGGALVARRRR